MSALSQSHLLKTALAHLEVAADATPTHRRYRATFGEALLAAGDDAAAEREFAAAVALGASGRAAALLGVARARSGDGHGAIAAADDAIESLGRFPLALYARALGRVVLGHVQAAESDLREAADQTGEPNFYRSELQRLVEGVPLEGRTQPPSAAFLKRMLLRASDLVRKDPRDEDDV